MLVATASPARTALKNVSDSYTYARIERHFELLLSLKE
jgi:hypothetical protein